MARLFKPQAQKKSSGESTPRQLHIVDLSHDGRGVARHEGKTVFVDGGLPGELVTAAHYRRHKRFSECQVKDVQQQATDRIAPVCPHFHDCGGCQLQHLQADSQLHYKQQSLLSLLQRQQHIEPDVLLQPARSDAYGYRARVRLGVNRQGRLAFRRQASDQLVAISRCDVLLPQLAAVLKPLQAWLDSLSGRKGVTHIELLAAADEAGLDVTVAVIRHVAELSPAARLALSDIAEISACWLQGEKGGGLRDLSGAAVDPRVYMPLQEQGVTLALHPQDFTQVNPRINQHMIAQALDWLDLNNEDCVADLFCGIGNFTLPLARTAKKVIGIEAVESMVVRGQENSAINELNNCFFRALDLESQALGHFLRQESINKLLLDPPRAGARFVCEQLADSVVERLVYVSCNPASFVRDAGILQRAGYRLAELRALDMFPQTAHMETMALFVPAKSAK